MPCRRALIAIALVLAASPVSAERRLDTSTKLQVTVGGAGNIHDTQAKKDYSPDPKDTRFVARGDVTVTLVVVDTNPLLFEYSATTKTEESADHAAAVAFAQSLQKLLALFPKSQTSDADEPKINGFSPVVLRGLLESLSREIAKLPDYLRLSTGDDQALARLRQLVLDPGVRTLPDRIEQQYQLMLAVARECLGSGAKLRVDTGVTIDCDAPYDLSLSVQESVAHSAWRRADEDAREMKTLLDEADLRNKAAQAAIEQWVAQAKVKALTANQRAAETLAKREAEVAKARHDQAASDHKKAADEAAQLRETFEAARRAALDARVKGITLREFISLALAMDTRVQKNAQLLRDFTNDVAKIGAEFEAAVIPYSHKDIRITTIDVKARTKYQPLMPEDVRKAQQSGVKSVTISVDAYRPARFAPGAAFVLGFVRNPTFKTVKDGDTFKIVKEEEELTRYDVAAMLNITPNGWREPTFGGFLQVGISPKKDEFGFYFGAGIQAQQVFSFGGGFMYQQVRRLADGLDMSSRLTDPAQLKTDTHFKPGGYLHITVTLPQK